MPFTPEVKRQIIINKGFDPNEYDVDEDAMEIVPKEPSIEQPSFSTTSGQVKLPPTPTNSALSTFGKSFAQSAPSSIAGGLGAAGGIALGGALAPETGGLSLLLPLLLGAGGGFGASKVAQKIQEKIEPQPWQENVAQAQAQHPMAAIAGNLASLPLGGLNPSPTRFIKAVGTAGKVGTAMLGGDSIYNVTKANELRNLINVGAGAGIGAGQTALEGGNPKDILLNTFIGGLFNRPNAIGKAIGFHDTNIPELMGDKGILAGTLQRQPTKQKLSPTPAGQEFMNPVNMPLNPVNLMNRITPTQGVWQNTPLGEQYVVGKSAEESAMDMMRAKGKKEKTQMNPVTEQGPDLTDELAQQRQANEARVKTNELLEQQNELLRQNLGQKQSEGTELPIRTKQAEEVLKRKGDVAMTPTSEFFTRFKQWIQETKGLPVDLEGDVTDAQGKPIAGAVTYEGQLPKLMKIGMKQGTAGSETIPHELSHAFMDALRASDRPRDRKMMIEYDKLVESSEDYQNWKAQRDQRRLNSSVDEYQATNQGYEFLKQHTNMAGETLLKQWWNDFRSYLTTRFGKHATPEDYQRLLNYRMVNEPRKIGNYFEKPSSIDTILHPKQSEESELEPTPGSYQSIDKHGTVENDKRVIDSIISGKKPFGYVTHLPKEYINRFRNKLSIYETSADIGYPHFYVAPKGTDVSSLFKKARNARSSEELGKLYGYTDKEIAEFNNRSSSIGEIKNKLTQIGVKEPIYTIATWHEGGRNKAIKAGIDKQTLEKADSLFIKFKDSESSELTPANHLSVRDAIDLAHETTDNATMKSEDGEELHTKLRDEVNWETMPKIGELLKSKDFDPLDPDHWSQIQHVYNNYINSFGSMPEGLKTVATEQAKNKPSSEEISALDKLKESLSQSNETGKSPFEKEIKSSAEETLSESPTTKPISRQDRQKTEGAKNQLLRMAASEIVGKPIEYLGKPAPVKRKEVETPAPAEEDVNWMAKRISQLNKERSQTNDSKKVADLEDRIETLQIMQLNEKANGNASKVRDYLSNAGKEHGGRKHIEADLRKWEGIHAETSRQLNEKMGKSGGLKMSEESELRSSKIQNAIERIRELKASIPHIFKNESGDKEVTLVDKHGNTVINDSYSEGSTGKTLFQIIEEERNRRIENVFHNIEVKHGISKKKIQSILDIEDIEKQGYDKPYYSNTSPDLGKNSESSELNEAKSPEFSEEEQSNADVKLADIFTKPDLYELQTERNSILQDLKDTFKHKTDLSLSKDLSTQLLSNPDKHDFLAEHIGDHDANSFIERWNKWKQSMDIFGKASDLGYRLSNQSMSQKNADYTLFPVTKPQIENVRELGPDGEKVASALEHFYPQRDQVYGKGMEPIVSAQKGLRNSDLVKIEGILKNENKDKQDYSHLLNAKQLVEYNAIRQSIKDWQQDRINANQPVMNRVTGKKELPKIDPFFFPNRIDPKIVDVLTSPKKFAERQRLESDFIHHQQSTGISQQTAQSAWDSLVKAYDKGQPDMARFNANREAQLMSLPDSMMRKGRLLEDLSHFFNRVGTDRAFHDQIEAKTDIASALGIERDPWGKRNPKNPNPIHGDESVGNIMKQIHGTGFDKSERQLKLLNRIATSMMLGPLTNIHIMGSSIANSTQYASPTQTPGAMLHAITHMGEGIQHAYETGYLKKNLRPAYDMLDAGSTALDRMSAIADTIGNLSGRDVTNKLTKGYLQAFGEYLLKQKAIEANAGKPEAINLMKHADPDWTAGKQYTPNELQKIASNFAGLIHGAHDPRTLPGWMLKDTFIQPFFQLASWNIAQTNQWMRHVWTPATKGDFVPLIMSTFGAVAGGYIIKEAREKLADKKSPIPSLQEMISSSRGVKGNIPIAAYNLIAMSSYVGYAGILSVVGKAIEDMAHKNLPQGAALPLDEIVSNPIGHLTDYFQAAMNDNNFDYIHSGIKLVTDITKSNFQLGRIATSWLANSENILSQEHYSKELNKKTQELRRYKMVEGQPYDEQTAPESNPYLSGETKRFKRTNDIGEAVKILPGLIQKAFERSHGNVDILKQELTKIKQNSYETMPNPDRVPMSFYRYLGYLTRTDGPEEASKRMMDYIMKQQINQVKGSLVPSF